MVDAYALQREVKDILSDGSSEKLERLQSVRKKIQAIEIAAAKDMTVPLEQIRTAQSLIPVVDGRIRAIIAQIKRAEERRCEE